jgi:CheY-like chemotaxis protein
MSKLTAPPTAGHFFVSDSSEDSATVCILDDKPGMVERLQDSLRCLGYSCIGTSDPEYTLELTEPGRVRVMMSDIKMPGMHGLQFVERSHLEDIGDLGCRFSLRPAVHPGSVIAVMSLGQNGETLIDEFPRLFVVIWIKRKGKRMTVGARSLRADELSDGDPQTRFSTGKLLAK